MPESSRNKLKRVAVTTKFKLQQVQRDCCVPPSSVHPLISIDSGRFLLYVSPVQIFIFGYKNELIQKTTSKKISLVKKKVNVEMGGRGEEKIKKFDLVSQGQLKTKVSGSSGEYRMIIEKITTLKVTLKRRSSPRETNLLKAGGEGLDLVLVFFFALVGL